MLAWVVVAVITALYASVVLSGAFDFIELPRTARENMGLEVTATGLFWLGFGVLFPIVIYTVSLLSVRRRRVPVRIFALVTGLGVVGAVRLEVSYLVSRLDFFV